MDDMTSSSSSSGERDEDGGTDGDFDTAAKGAQALEGDVSRVRFWGWWTLFG